jgi:hypothetical protein
LWCTALFTISIVFCVDSEDCSGTHCGVLQCTGLNAAPQASSKIYAMLRNIRGTIDDVAWDRVVFSAVEVRQTHHMDVAIDFQTNFPLIYPFYHA